jgi:8-oxo-dGTP pyrophosphatase MutT (NUDIX family)
MPPVSRRQEKAMYAAAEGESTLGIPESVGKEYVAADATAAAAGIMFWTPDSRALFLRRGADGDHAGEWCFPGGGIEQGETAEDAARREAAEETKSEIVLEGGPLKLLDRRTSDEGVDYSTFVQPVTDQFLPTLNGEHSAFAWAPTSHPPEPLHPGVKAVLSKIAMDEARPHGLAFDRASVRTYDRDGRLHVEIANISKAAVNPYIGREIPDYQALGLDPDKIYKLLRDPDELAKAAPTFNNIPLLSRHVPVTADNHKPDLVVGSTGTDAAFEARYLRNSLVLWARDAIEDIEREVKRELSSAYRYRCDMTPGTYEGEPYDGVMRDIFGNHLALVREGRAGSDVVVGDAAIPKLEELFLMSKKDLLTRKGAVAMGALMIALKPKLAMDAKIDLAPLFKGVTAKNFKEKKPAIVEGVTQLTAGKLAQDASINDVAALLDSLDGVEPAEAAADNDETAGLPIVGQGPNETTMDAGAEGVRQFLTGKLSDEDIAKVCAMIDGGAADELDPEADPNAPPALDEDKDKEMVDKPAMDAAIAKAVADTTAQVTKNQREIRDAERKVRPYVGELAIACDSAEAVYRAALTALGLGDKIKDVHASALRTILEMQPLPDSRPKAKPSIAMDAAGAKSFAERFPDANRIKLS